VTDGLVVQVVAVAALAGLVQGISGFAFALVCTALLAWVLPPDVLVPMVVCGSFVAQLGTLTSLRDHFELRRLAPFVIGGLLGVPLGTRLLAMLDLELFRLCVGIGLIVYSGIMLGARRFPVVRGGGRVADGAVGVLSGVMGGVSGLSGPTLTLWCALRGWPKEQQRAVFQAFFMSTQVMMIANFLQQGLLGAETWRLIAWLVPAAVIGSMVGVRLFKRFSDLAFRRLIFVLLFLSGVALVLPTLRALL